MKLWTWADSVFVVVMMAFIFIGFALANSLKAEKAKHRTELYQVWQKCEQSLLTEQEFWMLKQAGLLESVCNKHKDCMRDCAAGERNK